MSRHHANVPPNRPARDPGRSAWGTLAVAAWLSVAVSLTACVPRGGSTPADRLASEPSGQRPTNPVELRALADSLASADSFAASLPLYERVALAWPDSVAVIYRLGQILLLTGDPEASLERFHVARARQYRVTSALYNIAIARSRLGRLTEAFATLDSMMAAGFRNKYGLLVDEDLDILRSDRRWRPFISRVWGTSRDSTLSAPVQRLELRRNVAIPVRDGAVLRADIAVPRDESGPFPTVLIRTPYGRFLQFANRIHWAARGYVLVAQDVRGRGNSTGEFDPWMNEDSDGYDTIEWIVQQPWSDGRVGMIGASYGAQVQWLAAAAGHPALRAMISIMSGTDPFFDTPWDHGVLKMGLLDWLYSMTHPNAPVLRGDTTHLRETPLRDLDSIFTGVDLPIWNRWVERNTPDAWKRAAFLDRLTRASTRPAVLHVSGWWDVESIATDRNWRVLDQAGSRNQWLLYGPWEHNEFFEPPPTSRGDLAFGDAAQLDFLAHWVGFFDRWLKQRTVGEAAAPRVSAYLVGENRWVTGDTWPLSSTRPLDLFLARPDSGFSTGSLRTLAPATATPETFVHDPRIAPIREDPTFSRSVIFPEGAVSGSDQLAWVTSPLEAPLRIIGPVELRLTFSSDVPDADLYALLVSVAPDGSTRALAQPGKLRASFHAGFNRPVPLEPESIYQATIVLPPVGYRLPRGDRLGLVVRGDWLPRFAPSLHAAPGTEAPAQVARLTVYGGGARPSQLRVWALLEH